MMKSAATIAGLLLLAPIQAVTDKPEPVQLRISKLSDIVLGDAKHWKIKECSGFSVVTEDKVYCVSPTKPNQGTDMVISDGNHTYHYRLHSKPGSQGTPELSSVSKL